MRDSDAALLLGAIVTLEPHELHRSLSLKGSRLISKTNWEFPFQDPNTLTYATRKLSIGKTPDTLEVEMGFHSYIANERSDLWLKLRAGGEPTFYVSRKTARDGLSLPLERELAVARNYVDSIQRSDMMPIYSDMLKQQILRASGELQ